MGVIPEMNNEDDMGMGGEMDSYQDRQQMIM